MHRAGHPLSLVRKLYAAPCSAWVISRSAALGVNDEHASMKLWTRMAARPNQRTQGGSMQYFVTGATGFIGKRLVKILL